MPDSRKIQNRPEILPGQQRTDWWRAPAKDRRNARNLRDLEQTKLEQGDTGTLGAIAATSGDVLFFNGTTWIAVDRSALVSLDNLTDVSLAGVASGHILRYNGSEWVNVALAELVSLTDLSDVTITAPAAGQGLFYNGSAWVNQNWTSGNFGVGLSASPTRRFETLDGNFSGWFTGTVTSGSNSAGQRLSKVKTDTNAHGYGLLVGGTACWEMGMEASTNNTLRGGTGSSDLQLLDYSGAAGAVRRLMRVSGEERAGSGNTAKIEFGWDVTASPKDNDAFMQISASNGADQITGLRVVVWGGGSANGFSFKNANTANKSARLNWNDQWIMGPDIGALNVRHMYLAYDNVQNLSRVFVTGDSAINAKVGFGTDNPQAIVSAKTSNDTTLYDTVQRGFHMQYANQPSNRAVNIEQILDASAVWNYIWMNGGLGAGSTRATRVATSSFARAWGWECSDSEIALVSAPSGTNQTLTRLWKADNSGGNYRLGVFGVTPQARTAAYTQTFATTARTLPAYTTDTESVAYTGAADGEAKLADLNALRTAYENLRASYDETVKVLNAVIDDFQAYGWLQ